MDALGLDPEKVTHLRTSGIEHGTFVCELHSGRIATMSKHCHDERLFEAYITELFAPVMRVMAGFKQTATYHVPCTEVEPDCDAAECTRRVFPMWETWKEQQALWTTTEILIFNLILLSAVCINMKTLDLKHCDQEVEIRTPRLTLPVSAFYEGLNSLPETEER